MTGLAWLLWGALWALGCLVVYVALQVRDRPPRLPPPHRDGRDWSREWAEDERRGRQG